MAGTDVDSARLLVCPCKKGTVTIERCSPDHPYVRPKDYFTRTRIACAACAEDYTVVESRTTETHFELGVFVFVPKAAPATPPTLAKPTKPAKRPR